MQSLGRVLATTPDAFADVWYEPGGSRWGGATKLDGDSALHIPAVYACTVAISEDIGKSPMGVFEDLGEEGRRPARDHALHEVLHDAPNDYQTPIEFKEMVTAFALLRGLGVSEIRSKPGRPVNEIVPLNPYLVKEERAKPSGRRRYIYRDPMLDFEERTILAEDAFVVRGRFGKGVMDYALESLGLELSMERYSSFMFTRGSKHQGVITHPKVLPNKARGALRRALDEYGIEGPRAGRPLLLEDGMTWHDVSLANRDMEFLAQRKFGIEQICRWFRVPPHKIAELARSTNNNIERQSIDYVVDTLLAWVVRWEQAGARDLLLPDERARFFIKLNLDSLMRGDFEARSKAYAMAVQWGWLTRAEVREKEDLNPIPGLEEPLTPTNMTTNTDGSVSVGFGPTGGQDRAYAVRGQLRLLASDAASRVVRREVAVITKLSERSAGDAAAFRAGVDELYATHAEQVARDLHIPAHVAREYSREQRAAVLADGLDATSDWLERRVAHLTDIALDQPEAAAA